MNRRQAIAATTAVWTLGGSLALGFVASPAIHAHPHVYAQQQQPEEDSPEWSCVDDGNRVCGPGNSNGALAGCYDEGGVLVAVWPCEPHLGTGALPGPNV